MPFLIEIKTVNGSKEQSRAAASLIDSWVRTDLSAATVWASGLEEGPVRDAGTRALLEAPAFLRAPETTCNGSPEFRIQRCAPKLSASRGYAGRLPILPRQPLGITELRTSPANPIPGEAPGQQSEVTASTHGDSFAAAAVEVAGKIRSSARPAGNSISQIES